MRGFINLSIGIKLLISFILIAFIAGIVGTNGIIDFKKFAMNIQNFLALMVMVKVIWHKFILDF